VTLPSWTDCTGSKECATDRATLLQDAVEGAAVAADGAQRDVASAFEATTWPLDVALCADDCGAAGEYARALETPSPNTAVVASSVRQDAIRGVAEYCGKRAVPIGAPADLGTAKIAYKRLCFDDCPSYTLVVRGDGAMSFDGNGPSGRVIREGRLSGVEVNNLFGMLERIGFVRQADQDFPFGLDSPESRLTLEWRGLSHRIHAGMFELSEGVYFVENRLHAIAMAKGWVEELRGAMNGGP
jgi:hypothetical protein